MQRQCALSAYCSHYIGSWHEFVCLMLMVTQVHKRSGMRIHVSEKKLGALECIELPGLFPMV